MPNSFLRSAALRQGSSPLLGLLLAAMLLAAQFAGQLHALGHAQHDLAASIAQLEGRGGDVPPLDHSREQCVAFHALDFALDGVVPPAVCAAPFFIPSQERPLPLLAAARPPFSSRAPPLFFS